MVKFGTTAATGVTVTSATSLTATSPAGSGTVDVTVSTWAGTSSPCAADQFTYAVAGWHRHVVGLVHEPVHRAERDAERHG